MLYYWKRLGVPFVVLLCGLLAYQTAHAELSPYPPNQHPPNGIIGRTGQIDFSDLTIALLNDFILIVQVFVTCIPTGALAAVAPSFLRISCMFNMLSVLSLLSLSILVGWDKIDESRIFKIQMRQLFEGWAQGHNRSDTIKRDNTFLTPSLQAIQSFCNVLDLHFDMYVTHTIFNHHQQQKQRLICAAFEMGNSTMFTHKNFVQEICVSKRGIRRLGENKFSTLPLQTVRKLVKFLVYGGLIKTAINPPLFLLNTIQAYGDFTQEILQKIYEMVTIIDTDTWDGHEIGCSVYEEQILLLSITYVGRRSMR